MAEIAVSIATKAAESLATQAFNATVRQLRYFFCFSSNVKDFEKEKSELQDVQKQVQDDVKKAKGDAQEIRGDVSKWLKEAQDVLNEAQSLENEAKGVKSCFSVWRRYRLSRKATKKTPDVVKLRERGSQFSKVGDPAALPGIEFVTSKDIMISEAANFASDQIMEALKDDNVSVIGLHGMGGVGKTTLVKELGRKAKDMKLFENVIMAVVSQNPNVSSIQGEIAEALRLELNEDNERKRASRLMVKLKNESKILIVLDDVWNILNLTEIGIPLGDDHKGCKVLLTTRRQRVCAAMECQKIVSLDGLTENEALDLLKMTAGLNKISFGSEDVAEDIAQQCNGLPLALVIVGKAIKGKSLDEWKEALQQLRNSRFVNVEDVDQEIYATIKLSYDYLKEEMVRSTFLLCSLFPEDYKIPKEDLTRIGWGLGLFEEDSTIEDARRKMKVMINTLQNSSLLMDVDDDDEDENESVKLHDVVRDTALWIASKGDNNFFVKTSVWLNVWPHSKSFENYTAISLMDSKIEEIPDGIVCPKLKILLMEGVTVSDLFFQEMKALQVLRVENNTFLQQSLQFLTNLRACHMLSCKFDGLSAIGRLSKLEILSIHKDSNITELPREIGELKTLKVLELVSCLKLEQVSLEVVSELRNLEEFHVIDCPKLDWVQEAEYDDDEDIDDEEERQRRRDTNEGILRQLSLLSRLKKVSLEIDVTRIPNDFTFPRKWSTFNISAAGPDLMPDLDWSEIFSKRRTLRLKNMDGGSLNAFKELYPTVQCLRITKCSNFQNIIPEMDRATGMRDLYQLYLRKCKSVECVFDLTHHFQDIVERNHMMLPLLSNLTHLELLGLQNLKNIWRSPRQHLIIEESQSLRPFCLHQLKKLSIALCDKLEYVFPMSIAQDIQKLEELVIFGCNNLKQVFGRDEPEFVVRGGGKSFSLPKLLKLQLKGLPNLTGFYEEEDYHWKWPSLQELTLGNCPELSAYFITNLEENLLEVHQQLRVLQRGDMGELHKSKILAPEIFQYLRSLNIVHLQGQEELFLEELGGQNLKTLELFHVDDLKEIWKSSIHISSTFRYLTQINLVNCNHLESLFPTSSIFPVLKDIKVQGCKNLKCLLLNIDTISTRFPNLTGIRVEGAAKLEHIFKDDDGDMKKVMECYSSLLSLDLIDLPMLVGFCPRGYHFVFPKLSWLEVKGCPKLTTDFSIDVSKHVHAKAHTDDGDDDQRTLASSHANYFHFIRYGNINNLPQYTE